MRVRALPVRLAVPAALVILVAILGTLQYRWLGQVSEAERERLQKSVRAQAQAFADAFDAEVFWIHVALQAGGLVSADDPEAFARRVDAWREKAAFPQMVRAIYLWDADKPGASLLEYRPSERRFAAVAWPAALEPVRALTPGPDAARPAPPGIPHLRQLHEPIVSSVPALIVPVPSVRSVPTVLTPDRALAGLGFADRSLVVQLDVDAIRSTVLPALAAQHLPAGDADAYRIAVADAQNGSRIVYSRGLPPGVALDARRSDAAVPLFALRFDLAPRIAPRLGPLGTHLEARNNVVVAGSPGAAAAAGSAVPDASPTGAFAIYIQSKETKRGDVLRINARTSGAGAWRLVLQHPAGSLDLAVARARSRNAWLGFGVLAVLAAGVGLVLLNAQRAERLARQQMDFVATVSHELRTPLAVIRSAAQNLSAGVIHEPERTRHYGEMIDSEGRRLSDMVEQVLEYAGLAGGHQAGALGAVDVASLVQEVVASTSPIVAAAGIDLSADVADDLPAVRGEDRALARALSNLVANACKHAPDGRWIGITARRARRRGRDEVEITVSDRGRGIDAADLPHIFDPFYRGRSAIERQVPGNGLGLSLVKRIAEAAGGRVSVASSAGEGTVFTLSLAAVREDAATEAARHPSIGHA